jgi:hypothetical protein
MVALIVLNIIMFILLIFLFIYFLRNKKNIAKNNSIDEECDDIECVEYKHNKISNSEHVFVGRFVTDDEYQQMIKSRKSDISILLEDVDREYEHLKELNK